MLKMRKLLTYLGLLLIPAIIAVALFVFTGSGYRLSEQEASDIAYRNAGVSTTDVTQSQVRRTRSGLHGSYRISFSTAENQFTYTIDGQSGSILNHDSDRSEEGTDTSSSSDETSETTSPETPASSSPAVTREAALTTALNHAGLAETSVTNIRNDLRDDAGGQVYDISFDYPTSGLRYKYAVNAQSGVIVTYTTEYLSGATTANPNNAQ